MALYTVKKGNHFSFPALYKPFVNSVKGMARFSTLSEYDIEGVDQGDWNKLAGIAYGLRPHYNTALIGWRYNEEKNLFEVAPYYNVKGKIVQPRPEDILELKAGDLFSFTINKYGIDIFSHKGGVTIRKPSPVQHTLLNYRVVHYFGGNSPAPSDVSVNINWN